MGWACRVPHWFVARVARLFGVDVPMFNWFCIQVETHRAVFVYIGVAVNVYRSLHVAVLARAKQHTAHFVQAVALVVEHEALLAQLAVYGKNPGFVRIVIVDARLLALFPTCQHQLKSLVAIE